MTNSYISSDAKFEFQQIQYELFEYLGFTDNQKKGFGFFQGMTLPISAFDTNLVDTDPMRSDNSKATEYILSLVQLQTDNSLNWQSYKEKLDINYLQSKIYNFNFIYWKCLQKAEEKLDDALKYIPELELIIGKTPLDNDWIKAYFELNFNFNNINNLYYDFFEAVGEHLQMAQLSLQESIAAGLAFYNFILPRDIEGGTFLLSTIADSTTPLFTTLKEYPIIYTYHKKALLANHIFSSIFHFFTQGINPEILSPIHRYHQYLFYKEGTTELRKEWDFRTLERNTLIVQTFHNARAIMKSGFIQNRESYVTSAEIFDKSLINNQIDDKSFFESIEATLSQKHGYTFDLDLLRSNGEFIELIAMVYYETCLHSVVLAE